MKKKPFYQITLTEKQLQVYREALEFYSRFTSGQDYLPESFEWARYVKGMTRGSYHNAFDELKKVLFPELASNTCYSIGMKGFPNRDIAYEMYREVLVMHENERKKKEGKKYKSNVYSYPTKKISKEPMPVVKTYLEKF